MKTINYIFSLLSLIIFFALPVGAVKKIEANPINIAAMLAQKQDSANLASTCEYYGYVRQASEDGYTIYKHPANGSIIRYKFNDADANQKLATVEVKSKISKKEVEKILNDLNFKAIGNTCERQSFGYITSCSSGNNGFLVFTQRKKPKKEH